MIGRPPNADLKMVQFGPSPVRLSIVVPCYNEEAVIAECARQLRMVMGELVQAGKVTSDSQIVFVNDGSRDKTWEMIQELCAADAVFSGISLSRNFWHQGRCCGASCGSWRRTYQY